MLKAILKMCSYANVTLMLELFALNEGDTKAASVLATQLCEVVSLVMLNDVSLKLQLNIQLGLGGIAISVFDIYLSSFCGLTVLLGCLIFFIDLVL